VIGVETNPTTHQRIAYGSLNEEGDQGKNRTKEQQDPGGVKSGRINELGKKGEVEDRYLWVADIGEGSLDKHGWQATCRPDPTGPVPPGEL
jgi:hypothetical protein